METCGLLLFDLDGTLLRSDKRITERTLQALGRCREKGMMIGVSTSRGEKIAVSFIEELRPDILIASGGAVIGRVFSGADETDDCGGQKHMRHGL